MLDLTPDELLTTTRSVRKRLDLTRPVERSVIEECLEVALQAPTGSNSQGWQWIVVTDPDLRATVADYYKRSFHVYAQSSGFAGRSAGYSPERAEVHKRVGDSATYLSEHLHEVPVHLIPCIAGDVEQVPAGAQAGYWGSILPAVWSFMLAARLRGLGTAWTSLHLQYAKEIGELLGIPAGYSQAALIPVAYTIGTDFKPAHREPLATVLHHDHW